jgi:hypothetical protein
VMRWTALRRHRCAKMRLLSSHINKRGRP